MTFKRLLQTILLYTIRGANGRVEYMRKNISLRLWVK